MAAGHSDGTELLFMRQRFDRGRVHPERDGTRLREAGGGSNLDTDDRPVDLAAEQSFEGQC
jgi:hypothetical protein